MTCFIISPTHVRLCPMTSFDVQPLSHLTSGRNLKNSEHLELPSVFTCPTSGRHVTSSNTSFELEREYLTLNGSCEKFELYKQAPHYNSSWLLTFLFPRDVTDWPSIGLLSYISNPVSSDWFGRNLQLLLAPPFVYKQTIPLLWRDTKYYLYFLLVGGFFNFHKILSFSARYRAPLPEWQNSNGFEPFWVTQNIWVYVTYFYIRHVLRSNLVLMRKTKILNFFNF